MANKLLTQGFGLGNSPANILTGGLGLPAEPEQPETSGTLNLVNLGFGFGSLSSDILTQGLAPHGGGSTVQTKTATDTDQVFSTETHTENKQITVTDTSIVRVTEIKAGENRTLNAVDTGLLLYFDITPSVLTDDVFFQQTDAVTVRATDNAALIKSFVVTDTSQVVAFDALLATNIPPSLFVPDVTYATLDQVLMGLAGPLIYQVGLRLYDNDRALITDIKNKVAQVSMDWDETRSVKRTLTFEYYPTDEHDELERNQYIEPYIMYERPQLYGGKNVITEEVSFGFFTGLAHSINLDLTSLTISYTAYDLSTTLVSVTTNDIYTVPAGSGYDTIIRNICIAAGYADEDIYMPVPPIAVPTQMTWEAGTSYYNIVQKLADSINWQGPYIGFDNKMYFREYDDITVGETHVTYATDEASIILPTVQVTHDIYSVVNNVVIQIDDPMRTPFKETYTDMNVQNPYSYTNTGVLITQVYDDLDHIASATLAQERAQFIMQRNHTPHKISLSTWLDFRRGFYELYTLNIEPLHHVSTRWRCTGWAMDLSIGGSMTHNLVEVIQS